MRRCSEITRELSAPGGGAVTPAELAEHLVDCPDCARWSEAVARQDALWMQTCDRGPDGWAAAWHRIEATADLVSAERAEAKRRPSRKLWLFAGLAQAAVILLGVALLWKEPPKATAAPTLAYDLDQGQMGFLRVEGDQLRFEQTSLDEEDDEFLAMDFEILNYMEGLAQ